MSFISKPASGGAILNDNPFEYISAYFGILLAGGIAVGLNTQTSDAGLVFVLNDCEASILFTSPKFNRYLTNALPQVPSLKALVSSGQMGEQVRPSSCMRWEFAELCNYSQKNSISLPFRSSHDFAQIIYTSGIYR